MLEDAADSSFEHIVSWLPDGKSFVVHDKNAFVSQIMPVYFGKQNRWKSFLRQLNLYSIRRIGPTPTSASASESENFQVFQEWKNGFKQIFQSIGKFS